MLAIPLGHADSLDASVVGHKAANLARFAATFRVPPAFCLSTSVYAELKTALAAGGATERSALRVAIAAAYASLAAHVGEAEPLVAVRSSATAEDGADASFAGQHETILNVRGVDAVAEAVLDCWRSVASEHALAYRKEKGIDAPLDIAVLVQQMVDADVSAIAFGVDPVSGDDTVVTIDAATGLGDRIASGDVTPDRFSVRKSDLDVVARHGDVLTDAQLREVAKLVLALERANGHAVDVECAFSRGELYLLQCRPITTLAEAFPVAWRHPDDAKLHWRRDDAHFGGPVPRLVSDYSELGPSQGLQRRAELFDLPLRPRLEPFCGRLYATAMRRDVDGDLPSLQRNGLARVRADARGARKRWDEEQLPELRRQYAWLEARTAEFATLRRGDLASVWEEAWRRLSDVWLIHMLAVHAAFAMGDELAETYEKLTGGTSLDALRLTQARAPAVQQLERDLDRLATLKRTGDDSFSAELAAFLASPHGNLGNAGEDLRSTVWRDEPALLLAELDRRIDAAVESPAVRHARLIADGEAVEARARAVLRDRPADLARFEEVLTTARAVAPLTEEHNYQLDRQIQATMRRFIRAVAARMTTDGQLAGVDDVWLFHASEVAAALRDGRDLRPMTGTRQAEFAGWQRLRHPRTLGAPAAPLAAISSRADLIHRVTQDEAGVIKGVPASSGHRRARACLVRGAADFKKLRPGDVLVCRSSNVSWIPLFTVAAAIVTDVGGSLSHAAVVAREFGVPAVVGCGVALETLRDGQLVEVDGDLGTVRPLD